MSKVLIRVDKAGVPKIVQSVSKLEGGGPRLYWEYTVSYFDGRSRVISVLEAVPDDKYLARSGLTPDHPDLICTVEQKAEEIWFERFSKDR